MESKLFVKNEKKLRDLAKLFIANKGNCVIIKKDFFSINGYMLSDEEISEFIDAVKFVTDYIINKDEVIITIIKF